MATNDVASKPATPRRTTRIRTLSGLFKTPTRFQTPTATVSGRNKRTRARASSLSSSPPVSSTPSMPAIVLQTYSDSTDSIVLTALPSAPFCCHEDLLTMTRTQLEGVVRALNARLPYRMQIGPEVDFWQSNNRVPCGVDADDGLSRMSEIEMRRRIEELVGIRAVVGKSRVSRLGLDERDRVPQAPKAVRTRDPAWRAYEKTPWEMQVDDAEDQAVDLSSMIEEAMMGSSPLAERTKSGQHLRGRNSALSRLPILREENEGYESKEGQTDDSEERPAKRRRMLLGGHIVQEAGETRLIENMSISGSPLLRAEDDMSSDHFVASDEQVDKGSIEDNTEAPVDDAQVHLPHGRNALIKESALKRAPSAGSRKTSLRTRSLGSSIVRSKRPSSRRSSTPESTVKDSRKIAITSMPLYHKPDAAACGRVLRSHSQRSPNSTSVNASLLGRSKSEKYPRAPDLAFVTINRPRYRFTQAKPNRAKLAKRDRESEPSVSDSPAYAIGQSQQDAQSGVERLDRNHDHEKENNPKGVSRGLATSDPQASILPTGLCGFLSPRSRARSTSTVTTTRMHSPIREAAGDGASATTSAVNDGTAEHVWEALERMVVNSL